MALPARCSALKTLVDEDSQPHLLRWRAAEFFLLPLAHLRRCGAVVPEGLLTAGEPLALLKWAQGAMEDAVIYDKARNHAITL